ncbi:PadR family transcriptional regulator [Parvularcula sp. ZS-1/3]|uniref:PadR family transcriptional regulator n=1 Tax=Parvularcula mediterranea TaxID=2732508 RepID=A0A7Y3RJ55_9PROT|nr:helix-turn-helix transcriptional regulator [Parvularcula mediterranea]NNU14986.1 PadR family transcriptional regulator [Parvularcula mediterranea]
MGKHKNLGEFEITVLAAILHLGEEAYGVAISEEIESRAGRKVTVGALYTTLSRLEEKGIVSSRMGEATAARGGRAKKYFELTTDGFRLFHQSVRALQDMLRGLPEVGGEALA